MDINKVELKGRVSSDVKKRKTKNDEDWLTFQVVTNEVNPNAKIQKERSVATYTQIAVFNKYIVEKLLRIGIHQGSQIWLIGKLYAKNVEKEKGVIATYTNVIVQDAEILKTKEEKVEIIHNNTNEIETPF